MNRIASALRTGAVGALAVLILVVVVSLVGALTTGGDPRWYFLGGHFGPKLIPVLLVFGVAAVCLAVFLRGFLEDIGVLKPADRWQDWRETPVAPLGAGPESRTPAARGPFDRRDDSWPRKLRIAGKRRPPAPKRHRWWS